jgi:hypothetical protein
MPHQPPSAFVTLATLSGLFMWLQILCSIVISVFLRSDIDALNSLFAFGPSGPTFSRKPYLMRIKLFFPWVRVTGVASYSPLIRSLVWVARLAGTALLVCFCSILGILVNMVASGA